MSDEGELDDDEVLGQRARALASPRSRAGEERGVPHLVARIGGIRFGLPVERVEHVVSRPPITAVPGCGAGILGVAVVLGGLVPLANGALVLGLDPDPTSPGRVLVLTDGDERIGLVVDAVDGLDGAELDAFLPLPPEGARADARLLRASPTTDWFVLNVDAFLDDRRLSPIDHSQTTAGQGAP